jgi:hypothetical protein
MRTKRAKRAPADFSPPFRPLGVELFAATIAVLEHFALNGEQEGGRRSLPPL